MRNFLDIKTCIKVYYALVHSHINYGIHIWGSTYNVYLKPVQNLQKSILKNIFKNKFTQTNCNNLILNINQSCLFKIINYFKKHEIISKNISRYELRIQTIKTELPKKEKYRQYYGYIFSKFSHIIPNEIKNILDNVKYKRELKKWLIKNESLKKYIDQYKT